ncbi:MAG: phosphonopyruvate decarboxylase [Accumulibacter sp.]|jgi:phosphonopyruvate decarboxylase|uniref:phosphonopyruvate decarboxylase n=1 Tax=Accumulibacter sp. TaxID=2053492 RepID=UPI002FC33B15
MISPKAFHSAFAAEGVDFLAGVPDSLLKDFCAYVDAVLPPESHVIAANEGTAVGLAAGHHLATGGLPMVYLQNSGLGNAVNPLLSLADPEVYAIPMIVLVGWRGAPGVKDEPQHLKQGRVTPAMLEAMEIPYKMLEGDPKAAAEAASWAAETARATSAPVVLLVHKGAFGKAEEKRPPRAMPERMLAREAAILLVTAALPAGATIVATTGMISRELYDSRVALGQDRSSDFLTVGSMGHASQIALGIARAKPDAKVVCLDGDGAALMHLGGMATVGTSEVGDLLHIVLNNGAHDSVGGQPTVAQQISLTAIATACGYDVVAGPLENEADIRAEVARLAQVPGRRFLEVRVRPGSRADLGRPKESPAENKAHFIARLRG